MISAAEARQFKEHVWQYQLEQIDRAVKETIIAGGHSCILIAKDVEIFKELQKHKDNCFVQRTLPEPA